MPLQNRVSPFGEIVATAARGTMMGNRGIIHDTATKTLLKRRWSTRAWIICVCEFRGRTRKVMAQHGWTELFFLDEATALAAGHRPCFYCRRADANAFRAAWCAGNGIADIKASAMDAVLDSERRDGRAKRRHPLPCAIEALPDGTVIASDDEAFIVAKGRALRWSFAGYSAAPMPSVDVQLLTPPSTLRALGAGYRPVLHESVFRHSGT